MDNLSISVYEKSAICGGFHAEKFQIEKLKRAKIKILIFFY